MRPTVFSASLLRQFLRKNRIATLPQLKGLLGTEADITVFRKLKELSYRTSYSHRGSFYTLDEIAAFDERGLWSFDSVWFSRHGTLVATAEVCAPILILAEHPDLTLRAAGHASIEERSRCDHKVLNERSVFTGNDVK